MVTPIANTNINIPQTDFLDENGRPSRAWLLWLQNPNLVGANLANPLSIQSGGTQVTQAPQPGQVLIGAEGTYQLGNIQAGNGVQVINGDGSITIDSSAVLNVSGGDTGMTFTETSDGQTTMEGTLKVENGGTGNSSALTGFIIGNGTSAFTDLAFGATGTFKSADTPAKIVTVVNGLITSIV